MKKSSSKNYSKNRRTALKASLGLELTVALSWKLREVIDPCKKWNSSSLTCSLSSPQQRWTQKWSRIQAGRWDIIIVVSKIGNLSVSNAKIKQNRNKAEARQKI